MNINATVSKKPRATSHIDQRIGRNIVIYRKKAGLSQGRLGEIVGVTYQQIQKYENATDRVSAARLSLIARALKVPAALLFDTDLDVDETASTAFSRDLGACASVLAQMSGDMRKRAIAVLRALT